MLDIFIQNITSAVVLFFLLGIIASLVKSDLAIPKPISEGLSIYLLIAIGLKGGVELAKYPLSTIIVPTVATIILGVSLPILAMILLKMMKIDLYNSIGLAATYGSVSIVTYGATISFFEKQAITYEGYMHAMVVIMESPAIITSILLMKMLEKAKEVPSAVSYQTLGITRSASLLDKHIWKETFFGKSVLLLLGSLCIGYVVQEEGFLMVKPLFSDFYGSMLALFLLYMGLVAGERLTELKAYGWKLILFAVMAPVIFGTIGVLVGNAIGLSVGGATIFGVLAGSASYIAAPAALKTSVPKANPSIYIGLALGITFPFNLAIGIPLIYKIAQILQ